MSVELMGREIKRVYRGQNGKCCCGCSGKYTETEAAKKRAAKEIQSANGLGIDMDRSYVALEKGSRILIAYFE